MNRPKQFKESLEMHHLSLIKKKVETLQINMGKKCNQFCNHCHVDAGPKRKEMMDERTATRIIELLGSSPSLKTLDITGGAPELNPHFKKLVRSARLMNLEVIDRCNLTIFFEHGMEKLPDFLKNHQVHIVASLPCYTKENVERQRGKGVFQKSIEALKILNNLGYGKKGTSLVLDLVYNPGGYFLPGDQKTLEADYKRELKKNFDLEFNHLFTITNMPIKRFLDQLVENHQYDQYMDTLSSHFNPEAARQVMCLSLISVGHDGGLYDCDFNQMMDIPINFQKTNIWDIENFEQLINVPVAITNHCYGCTAGSGSSCTGSLL